MVVGDDEVELLREQLILGVTREYLRRAFFPDTVFIRDAVVKATEGWRAYRVRRYTDEKLEERWQVFSQWSTVEGIKNDGRNGISGDPGVQG